MKKDMSEQGKILYKNRLMRTDEEFKQFEKAREEIIDNDDYKGIKYLCEGFDDNTEEHEVMWGLLHTVEYYYSYSSDKPLKEFISAIPNICSRAREWVELMIMRILNHKEATNVYIKVAKECDNKLKLILIELMEEIKKEDPELFSEKVDHVINMIK